MTLRTVTWQASSQPLGTCVVAIGVFDGVHLGHQRLLADTVRDAATRGVAAVAVTFDRDPDQVVSPETAAPQLLTLDDKERLIAATGVDTILVVPFTEALASLDADAFVDEVLCSAVIPLAVHVGSDFRFGRGATGDVDTLRAAVDRCGWDVVAHDLLAVDGIPVTSTRVRSLVADGRVADACRLLGRPTRVAGHVHHGRGEGATLGFPTVNVVPAAYPALPGDGVYAGRAIIEDGSTWPAAISVGTPPSFPEARDYLEAHLIGFTGDLYGSALTLEFLERLREQRSYDSLDALKGAIALDVAQTIDIGESTDSGRDEGLLADGRPVVADPGALEVAEAAAMRAPSPFDELATGDWVPLATDLHFSYGAGESQAADLIAPLGAANIPYAWDPFPPEQASGDARDCWARPFTLLVPAELLSAATQALADAGTDFDAGPQSPGALIAPAAGAQWAKVVSGLPFDRQRLTAIDAGLDSAGIEHAWQPYAPQEAPLLRLGIFGTERFSVSVPAEQLDSATHLLEGLGEFGSGVGNR